MIPRLLIISPGDRRSSSELQSWISILGQAGAPGLILREFNRDKDEMTEIIQTALKHFEFVSLHQKSIAPKTEYPKTPATHLSSTPNESPPGMFGQSCHSSEDLRRSFESGAAYTLLSPVFRPNSKASDSRNPLGIKRFVQMADDRIVLALGGITAERYQAIRTAGGYGAAVLGDFQRIVNLKQAHEKLEGYNLTYSKINNSES